MSVSIPRLVTPTEAASELPLVVVVMVTYGRAEDAIEAIASLLQSTHSRTRIILCDNASPDRALDRIRAFAKGQAKASSRSGCPVEIAWPKGEIDHVEIDASEGSVDIARLPRLTLVDTKGNRGYAGGNNVALKWLEANSEWDYGIILNPDTVVDPGAISALVAQARANPGLGAIGSRIFSYDSPDVVHQWAGGTYSKLRGSARLIGLHRSRDERPNTEAISASLDYVAGSAFFFTRAFLRHVGLMDEGYFLYYEELDWCLRRGDFRLGYAHDAVIYHRHGASIGTSVKHGSISPLSIYWQYRSRFRFTRKFFPWALPSVYAASYLDMLRMISKGAWRNAILTFRAVHGLLKDPAAPTGAVR